MKTFAVALFALTSVTAFAAPAAVPGSWVISGDVQGYPVNETCTFAVDKDNKVTGTCSFTNKDYDVTGTLDGTKLTFKHGGEYEGEALNLTWTGDLADDGSLAGAIDVQPLGYSGTFTAKKTESQPASAAK